jgi:DNA-binding transcriptional LysR family regulator
MVARVDLLDKMATFVRVLEAGSFSAAAKQLRISPAAVSRQIATLEGELGVTLLQRSTRRMSVTSDGERYYERCLRILRDVDEAQAIGRGGALEGFLSVSAPVTFGLACVVPHLHALMTQHLRLRLDLRLEDRPIDLVVDGVDVAIRVGLPAPDSTGLVAQPLLSFRRALVAAPAYLKRRGEPKTPEALARHDALSFSAGFADSWTLASGEREARVRVNAVFRSNALFALRDLAVAGAGVTMLPKWFVAGEVRRRALRFVLPAWQGEPVPVNAIYRVEQRGAPRVRALIEHLRGVFARLG